MKIGNVNILNTALMAPLAGFTDVGFRHIARAYGAGLTYTEMISCKGMVYGSEKTRELLAVSQLEMPCAVQIFGCDPDIMARAVEMPEMQKFDIIDINMGCPVPKIVKNGEGSALMLSVKTAQAVVKAVAQASNKPVTVKTRLGFNQGDFCAVDFAKAMQDAGAAALTIHGRYREQYYSGNADMDKIAEVARAVTIPVIANGDICSAEDYARVLNSTGAAAAMIARGALGNPQIFLNIAQKSGLKTYYSTIDIKRDLLEQIEMLKAVYNDHYIYSNMKKHICYYAKGRIGSKQIKDRACRAESIQEIIDTINQIF